MDEFENESLFEPEDPEDIAREVFEELDPDEAEQMLRKLDQDRVNDTRLEWKAMYGFDHECSCAADIEEGNTLTIPACYGGAAAEAFDNLRRVRVFLYAIATSPTNEAGILKALAAEAFHV